MEVSTMEKMKNKGLIEREQKMSYKNFNVAVYCPVVSSKLMHEVLLYREARGVGVCA